MNALSFDSSVTELAAEDLQRFLTSHSESEYVLVDVRQPEEYEKGHLPGAKLLPLVDLDARMPELESEKHTVFYCETGRRSGRAACQVAESNRLTKVYLLLGGLAAWRGETLPDVPNVRVFDGTGSLSDVLIGAMDLEKGAHRLYRALIEHFGDTDVSPMLVALLGSEVGHAKMLYSMLCNRVGRPSMSFNELFASLTGDLLESGEYLDEAVSRVGTSEPWGRYALLELALELEYRAYDLYRSLYHEAPTEELRQMYVELADHEKHHIRTVLRSFGHLLRSGGSQSER